MQDRQLYAEILGIRAPWFVDRVQLKLRDGAVHVHLEHHEVEPWPCPECGEARRRYDHQPERPWRHLITCQYQTILAKPPQAEYGQHEERVVKLTWAGPSSAVYGAVRASGDRLADGGQPEGGGPAAGLELRP